MHTLEPTGIYLSGYSPGAGEQSILIPYVEITRIRKISLAENIVSGLNLFKPGIVEEYEGVVGDPLHFVMIETEKGRYLTRGDDLDEFVVQANQRLAEYRKTST